MSNKHHDSWDLINGQTYSAPVMDALKIWMQSQFDERKVEPNSALGRYVREC